MGNAIANIGQAAVPLNMLVLGSSLASIPSFLNVDWTSTLAVVFTKLVLVPSVAFGFMTGLHNAGVLEKVVPDFHMQHEIIVVACLVSATPTANNLSVMAEISGGPQCKRALSIMTFLMYCVAP